MFGAGADVFAVWGYVIAHAVASQVELNPQVIAAAIGMTPERAELAIAALCAPDPRSRSRAEDGRRLIQEGEYAYRVTNHDKYRLIRHEEDRREYNREAQRRYRAKKKKAPVKAHVIDSQSLSTVSAQAEAEAEADKRTTSAGAAKRSTQLTPFGEAWRVELEAVPNYGAMAKPFTALLALHPADEIAPVWRHYLRQVKTDPYKTSVRPQHFCENYGKYADECRPLGDDVNAYVRSTSR